MSLCSFVFVNTLIYFCLFRFDHVVLDVSHLAFEDCHVDHFHEQCKPENVQHEKEAKQAPADRHIRLQILTHLCILETGKEEYDLR